jgi:cholesterol transport system auxiliary component
VRKLRAGFCALLLMGLAGCISLFPKVAPVQLYRFGGSPPASSPAPESGRTVYVQRSMTGFASPAAGDRILTVDGDQTAYIADARWASSATELFDEAETQAFEAAGGPVRLLRAGDPASPQASLRLDVQTFEVRYLAGPNAAPTVVIEVHALLVSMNDRKVLGDETFESQAPASDNRVSAIVQAFDGATNDVLGKIIGWTDQRAAG